MNDFNTNNNGSTHQEQVSFKDYLNLIRNNFVPICIIILASLTVSIIYAVNAKNIYKSTTSIKINKPKGNILEAPLMPEFQDFGSDRFIANEIEILKSYNIREKVADAVIDTFKNSTNKNKFYLILDKSKFGGKDKIVKKEDFIKAAATFATIEQKRGLDIVEISVESPSPYEAALIANCFAQEYKNLNLEINRNQLTVVKQFLKEQKEEKQQQLSSAEEILRSFQEKGGIIALDAQSTNLIEQLSNFEAQKNAVQIELSASTKVLNQYREELEKQNPRLADYLTQLSSEVYIKALQEQISKFEITRDIAAINKNNSNNDALIKDYNNKISDLNKKLNDKLKEVKAGIFASSPEEVKLLSQKIIEEEVKNNSLRISLKELEGIVKNYDKDFNELPKTTIELARFQRNRESLEKLYVLVEEKYQEALINEQSQPGNVLIIDDARMPVNPSKPNRMLIVLIGFVLGTGMAVGYVVVRNYFDNTVKTPEDIKKKNINVLAWIPQIEGVTNDNKELEFIVSKKPDSIPSEAFRALRTRVQFAKLDGDETKTILVTSSSAQEGKTTICVNLAASFAQSNKRTLIIDCDLRKPRVHNVFGEVRTPGLVDYLFGQAGLNEIIRASIMENLFFIPAGTIPPNPSELLESKKMKEFMDQIKDQFEIILLDSPPIIAVTDSEIISRRVDTTLLVVSSETTEMEIMEKSVEILKRSDSFIGTVLNNFSYKMGYGSYYKYYYYYSKPNSEDHKTKHKSKSLS